MKILFYLERAWIVAGAAALIVMIFNAIKYRTFDNHVYFPLFCAMFCFLIWYNIRGQRRFRDKMIEEEERKRKENQSQ